MKKTLISTFAAGAISLSAIVPALAAPPENRQVGGAAGLVAAVVGVQDVDVVDNINVAFRDINVVRNVLNNSPILNDSLNDVEIITIEDALNDNVITVEALNDLNIDIDDVVAVVQVLGGGVLVLT